MWYTQCSKILYWDLQNNLKREIERNTCRERKREWDGKRVRERERERERVSERKREREREKERVSEKEHGRACV